MHSLSFLLTNRSNEIQQIGVNIEVLLFEGINMSLEKKNLKNEVSEVNPFTAVSPF